MNFYHLYLLPPASDRPVVLIRGSYESLKAAQGILGIYKALQSVPRLQDAPGVYWPPSNVQDGLVQLPNDPSDRTLVKVKNQFRFK